SAPQPAPTQPGPAQQPASPAPQQQTPAPPAITPDHAAAGGQRSASLRQPVTVHGQAEQIPYETIPASRRELALAQPVWPPTASH
ncbi:MAG: hypothetical protein ACRD5L_10525, partial [Bryobacteraceae bacterium]